MKLFKIKEEICVDGCPYYREPAVDILPNVYGCNLQYLECCNLEQLRENCPLRNIENLLEDFMQYIKKNNYDFEDLINFQLANRLIYKFIEEEVL